MNDLFVVSDLNCDFDGQPRIRDILLGERLGYERPRKIRDLIEKNITEVESFGPSPRIGAMVDIGSGAQREAQEYWLNEAQALLVCMFSRTDAAAMVRRSLIQVFMAWRRGQLRDKGPDFLQIDDVQLPLLLSLVREMRLVHGRKAAQALWRRLPLPFPELEMAEAVGQDETVSEFLAECCEFSLGALANASELYRAYEAWCDEYGIDPMNQARFGRQAGKSLKKQKRGGTVQYVDVRLKGE